MEIIDNHKCNICNKSYSSYSSLWNHNKNIHKNNIIHNNKNTTFCKQNDNINNLICNYCNKIFSHRNSKWVHEKKCKIVCNKKEQEKQLYEIKIAEFNKEIKLAEIDKEKEIELAKINLELKKVEIKKETSLIKKEQKSHNNPTIKKINKMLQNNINMKNSNNNNTINNIVQHNHFKIEPFGKENILDIITDKEKKLIINQGHESIEKLIEITNAGKYDQFKNIMITNKRENDAYIYDEKTKIFISCDKNWALCKLITNRLDEVEEIYNAGHVRFCKQNHSVLDEFDEKNKLSDNTKKILSSFFIKMSNENDTFIDENSNNSLFEAYIRPLGL